MDNSLNQFYDVYEVAQKFNVSPSRVYSQARAGYIPKGDFIAGRHLWEKQTIDSFIAKNGTSLRRSSRSIEYDEVAVKFFKTLKTERTKRLLTVAELARRVGVKKRSIFNYERGYMPSPQAYDALAKELGWPLYGHYRNAPAAVDTTPQKAEPQTAQIPLPLTQAVTEPPLTIPKPLDESIRYLARIKGVNCNTLLASILENALTPYKNALNVLKGFKLD